MADDGGDFVWNGVLDPAQLIDSVVAAGHRLADAAKMGEWSTVFRMLDEDAQVNWWRPGGTAWFTVLHQAAWHGVSADVARELIARGALRTQTDSRGRTAYDVAMERHATTGRPVDALCEVLLPPSAPLPPHRVQVLDRHLAEVIDGRIKGVLYDGAIPVRSCGIRRSGFCMNCRVSGCGFRCRGCTADSASPCAGTNFTPRVGAAWSADPGSTTSSPTTARRWSMRDSSKPRHTSFTSRARCLPFRP